jgi:VanZ family protein
MIESEPERIAGLLRLGFWASLLVALFMALSPHPPHTVLDHYGDKVQHMLAFGVLTFLAQCNFGRTPRWRIAERLSFLGALIEVSQSLPILHRDCDIYDWVADTIVVVIVTGTPSRVP